MLPRYGVKDNLLNWMKCFLTDRSPGHVMEWNGMEWKMEWKRNFGMEYGRLQVWKGMEDFKNGMECHLPYFPYLD